MNNRPIYSNRSQNFWLCFLLFAVGAGSRFDISLIGRVPLSEILAFGSAPFLLNRGFAAADRRRLVTVFWILGLWASAIVISDIWNGNYWQLSVRGFAKPVFALFWCLFFIGVFAINYRALLWYPLGGILSAWQNYLMPRQWTEAALQTGEYNATFYGFVPIVTSAGVAAAVWLYGKNRWYSVAVMTVVMGVLIYLKTARGSVFIYFLSILLLGYIGFSRSKYHRRIRLTVRKVIVLGLMALVGGYVFFEGYVWAAQAGLLGEGQKDKLAMQSATVFGDSPLGIVLGGRPPIFGAILGILDRPIFGFGSWTGIQLTDYYLEAVNIVGSDVGTLKRASLANIGVGHSIFFQAWVENGIFAAIALGVIAFYVVRALFFLLKNDHRLAPYLVLAGVSFVWDFMFSPFGTPSRYQIGLFLAIFVMGLVELPGRGRALDAPPRRRYM